MATTYSPLPVPHAVINIPENVTDLVDAAYMALNTWKQLADNAKYALDQIDTKITLMKNDDALVFAGDLVEFANDVKIDGALDVIDIVPVTETLSINADVTLIGTARKFSGGRRVENVVTYSTWVGDPAEQIHSIVAGAIVRVITTVGAHLRLSTGGCVEGDWVTVTLSDGGTLAVHNGSDVGALWTATTDGEQRTFTYTTASGWVL